MVPMWKSPTSTMVSKGWNYSPKVESQAEVPATSGGPWMGLQRWETRRYFFCREHSHCIVRNCMWYIYIYIFACSYVYRKHQVQCRKVWNQDGRKRVSVFYINFHVSLFSASNLGLLCILISKIERLDLPSSLPSKLATPNSMVSCLAKGDTKHLAMIRYTMAIYGHLWWYFNMPVIVQTMWQSPLVVFSPAPRKIYPGMPSVKLISESSGDSSGFFRVNW